MLVKNCHGVEKLLLNVWTNKDIDELYVICEELLNKLKDIATISIKGNCNAYEKEIGKSPLIDLFKEMADII